jgi:hypothetical protein
MAAKRRRGANGSDKSRRKRGPDDYSLVSSALQRNRRDHNKHQRGFIYGCIFALIFPHVSWCQQVVVFECPHLHSCLLSLHLPSHNIWDSTEKRRNRSSGTCRCEGVTHTQSCHWKHRRSCLLLRSSALTIARRNHVAVHDTRICGNHGSSDFG